MVQKWINVTDILPEEDVRVLTYDSYDDEIKIDYLIDFCGCEGPESYLWACRWISDLNIVDYWMPLPERPEISHN